MRNALLLALLVLVVMTTAQADDGYRAVNSRFQVYAGGFFPDVDSKIAINGNVLPDNPVLDFENVFGLEDSKTLAWGGARWRISRRNMLELEFQSLNRDGSTAIVSDPIEIGDSIIQAGAQVDTTFDVTVGRLTYGFAFVANERMLVQFKAGLHLADLSASIAATGAVCVDGEIPPNCSFFASTPRRESEDITAPLPHFGGAFAYGITPSVTARLQVIGFALELDDIDGSLVEIDADLIWNPWQNFGFGAGVRYLEADVESKGSDLNGSFDFSYFGPVLYVIGTF